MAASFFFYDLETSGISPRDARIMQFAGQRTDMELNPIGEPINLLIQQSRDLLPDPDAIMVTGITPQQTLADGLTEAEFLKTFYDEIVQPDTIFLGFNSVRFDDEFMRFLNYRNFYDAYEWQWSDKCSRWDLLDAVRMTRALRPEDITWPFTDAGKPTNRLELLTKLNGVDHEHAHDALNDVLASISIAKLLRDKQPGLFQYLLDYRDKGKVKELVEKAEPFVYTSGRYPSETLHTTIAVMVAQHPQQCAYVYDLRHDPAPFMAMNEAELAEACRWSRDPSKLRLPVKTIKYNRCPAIAPTGVVKDKAVQDRLQLDLNVVAANLKKLRSQPDFGTRVAAAYQKIDAERGFLGGKDSAALGDPLAVDGQLYDGFIPKPDCAEMKRVRQAEPRGLASFTASFQDKRLQALLPLYKARNYPAQLSDDERQSWDEFCRTRLIGGGQNSRLAKYFKRLDELARTPSLTENQRFLLEELQLSGQSIMPSPDELDVSTSE